MLHMLQLDRGMVLSGTAEVPLAGMFAGRLLEEETLPRKLVAFSHCFRHEAGAGGQATKVCALFLLFAVMMTMRCRACTGFINLAKWRCLLSHARASHRTRQLQVISRTSVGEPTSNPMFANQQGPVI